MFQKLTKIYHNFFSKRQKVLKEDKVLASLNKVLASLKKQEKILNDIKDIATRKVEAKKSKGKHVDAKTKSQFLRLYAVAIADRDFDTSEKEFLIKFAKEKGVEEDRLKNILFEKINIKIPKTNDEKLSALYDLVEMIWVDEEVKDEEKKIFTYFTTNFKIENSEELFKFLLYRARRNWPLEDFKDKIEFIKAEKGFFRFKEKRPTHSMDVKFRKNGHAAKRAKERFDYELTQDIVQKAWDKGKDITFSNNPEYKNHLEKSKKKYPNSTIKDYLIERKAAFWVFQQIGKDFHHTLMTVYPPPKTK